MRSVFAGAWCRPIIPSPFLVDTLIPNIAELEPMVWFYKRGRVSLSIETRYDNETQEYVAVVARPDGRQQTERFRTREAFREWLMAMEQQLAHEQWEVDGPPHVVPDGWPDKPPLM